MSNNVIKDNYMNINGLRYLTEKELSTKCGKSLRWLKKIRYDDSNFPYYKLNGRVYFIESEVNQWLADNLVKIK